MEMGAHWSDEAATLRATIANLVYLVTRKAGAISWTVII